MESPLHPADNGLSNGGVQMLTVVLPCYNEAQCVPTVIDGLESALRDIPNLKYEFLIVDDGSTDGSAAMLEGLRAVNPRIAVIRFARNFGHQAALLAGIEHARGDAVVMMDSDLQHPPELLPRFVELWRSGFDIVQGVRESQPGLRKSLTSRLFYLLVNRISDVELRDGAADYRLMSRRAVTAFLALPEQTRFIRGIVAWLGFPSASVTFHAGQRHAGRSRYRLASQLRLAMDAVITLTTKPLSFALVLAGVALTAVFGYLLFVVRAYASGQPLVRGWTSTMLAILLLGSANLFCTGVLGLYVREVLAEVRHRPRYVIGSLLPSQKSRAAWAGITSGQADDGPSK